MPWPLMVNVVTGATRKLTLEEAAKFVRENPDILYTNNDGEPVLYRVPRITVDMP